MSSDECYSDEDFEDDFEDLTEVSPSKEPLEESSDSVLGTSLPPSRSLHSITRVAPNYWGSAIKR